MAFQINVDAPCCGGLLSLAAALIRCFILCLIRTLVWAVLSLELRYVTSLARGWQFVCQTLCDRFMSSVSHSQYEANVRFVA